MFLIKLIIKLHTCDLSTLPDALLSPPLSSSLSELGLFTEEPAGPVGGRKGGRILCANGASGGGECSQSGLFPPGPSIGPVGGLP